MLSYREIGKVVAEGATVTMIPDAAVKEVVWGSNQWASYDDADTINIKTQYANDHCLGG
jgi:chitinase